MNTQPNFNADFAKQRIRFYALLMYRQMTAFYSAVENANKTLGIEILNIDSVKRYLNSTRPLSISYYERLCDFFLIPICESPEEYTIIKDFYIWYDAHPNQRNNKIELLRYFRENLPETFNVFRLKNFESNLREELSHYNVSTLTMFYNDMDYFINMDKNDFSFLWCYVDLNSKGKDLVSELLAFELKGNRFKYSDESIKDYKENFHQAVSAEYTFSEIQEMLIERIIKDYPAYQIYLSDCLDRYERIDIDCITQVIQFRKYYKTIEGTEKDVEEYTQQILYFLDTLLMIPSTSI